MMLMKEVIYKGIKVCKAQKEFQGFQSAYEICLFHHTNITQEVFSLVLSCRTVDFSPVTKAGSASVGRAAFLLKRKEVKDDSKKFQKSSQVEETCTFEVLKCWCSSWPGGAVVCTSLFSLIFFPPFFLCSSLQ